jgi:hypothetical protein
MTIEQPDAPFAGADDAFSKPPAKSAKSLTWVHNFWGGRHERTRDRVMTVAATLVAGAAVFGCYKLYENYMGSSNFVIGCTFDNPDEAMTRRSLGVLDSKAISMACAQAVANFKSDKGDVVVKITLPTRDEVAKHYNVTGIPAIVPGQ